MIANKNLDEISLTLVIAGLYENWSFIFEMKNNVLLEIVRNLWNTI
jgi:hypothetical protein